MKITHTDDIYVPIIPVSTLAQVSEAFQTNSMHVRCRHSCQKLAYSLEKLINRESRESDPTIKTAVENNIAELITSLQIEMFTCGLSAENIEALISKKFDEIEELSSKIIEQRVKERASENKSDSN